MQLPQVGLAIFAALPGPIPRFHATYFSFQ
jgi:hypothetical protein